MLGYHVTQEWTDGEDLKAFASLHPWSDETIRVLIQRALKMWEENWSVDKARDYYDHDAQHIHIHENLVEAQSFMEKHGGCVLEVVLDGLNIQRNEKSLFVPDVIPAERVRRLMCY
jgi:hypothetical protein